MSGVLTALQLIDFLKLRPATTKQIAHHFHINRRTAMRYINVLSEAGVAVYELEPYLYSIMK